MTFLLPDRLYHADAFDLLKMVEPGSVQLILTDPPYGVSRESHYDSMGRVGCDLGEWDYGFDLVGWLDLALPALAPNGSIVIWTAWQQLGALNEALTSRGLEVARQFIWEKTCPLPGNRDRMPASAVENAIWARKPGWVFNRRPGHGYETGIFRYPAPRARKGQRRHPTQKPVDLFADLIEIHSNAGDLVLDPFAGAGTTAVAASRCGRRFICIEREREWIDLAPASIERGILEPEGPDPIAADAA